MSPLILPRTTPYLITGNPRKRQMWANAIKFHGTFCHRFAMSVSIFTCGNNGKHIVGRVLPRPLLLLKNWSERKPLLGYNGRNNNKPGCLTETIKRNGILLTKSDEMTRSSFQFSKQSNLESPANEFQGFHHAEGGRICIYGRGAFHLNAVIVKNATPRILSHVLKYFRQFCINDEKAP